MANGQNAPYGLRPYSSIQGGSWSQKENAYRLSTTTDGLTTYASSIFTGDPVIFNRAAANNGGGTVAVYPTSTDGAAASQAFEILGVFQGCRYTDVTGESIFTKSWVGGTQILAGSEIIAYILDDPSAVFNIQVSTAQDVLDDARLAPTAIGGNFPLGLGGGGANLVPNNPATGSARTGQSAMYLANGFIANPAPQTTATLPLKIIGYTPDPNNLNGPISYTANSTAPFLNVLVMINNHVYKAGTTGTLAV